MILKIDIACHSIGKKIKHLSCREHFTIYEFTNTSYRPNVLLFIIVYYHFRTTDNINIVKSKKCFVGPMIFEEKIFFSINQKKNFLVHFILFMSFLWLSYLILCRRVLSIVLYTIYLFHIWLLDVLRLYFLFYFIYFPFTSALYIRSSILYLCTFACDVHRL